MGIGCNHKLEKHSAKIQKLSLQEWPKFIPFEGTNSSPPHVSVGCVCIRVVRTIPK